MTSRGPGAHSAVKPLSPPLAVLHVVPSINAKTGGPAASVPGLAGGMAREGVASTIASLDYPDLGAPFEVAGVEYLYVTVSATGRVLRGWSPSLARTIRSAAESVGVVHSHALWMVPGIYARRAAQACALPLVISPRGMLDPWSLARHGTKKRLAALLYEGRNLRAARLLHATSELEAESIRRYGLKQSIVVLPNGVDLPKEDHIPAREVLEKRFPQLRGKRWLLFMGRLDPKKGLDLLTALWRELGPQFPQWHLLVAGPDISGFGAKLAGLVDAESELRERTTFTGMLAGADKSAALAHSELFVLPTHGENFGLTVAESLAHGTPVVTTTAAPWADLTRFDCGWWVLPEEGAIRSALEMAMNSPREALSRMGERGRAMVRDQFSWSSIAGRWVEVYRWLIEGGDQPPSVRGR